MLPTTGIKPAIKVTAIMLFTSGNARLPSAGSQKDGGEDRIDQKRCELAQRLRDGKYQRDCANVVTEPSQKVES